MGSRSDAQDLTRIPGVGAARARKLSEAGYDSVSAVAGADASRLAADSGISEGHADRLIAAAGELPELSADGSVEDVVDVVEELSRRLSSMRARVERLSARVDSLERSSSPPDSLVAELSAYIRSHLSSYSDDQVRAFLSEHGHAASDIDAALSRARG